MSSGLDWYFGPMCCICHKGITPETCWRDEDGHGWDFCSEECARLAGHAKKPE